MEIHKSFLATGILLLANQVTFANDLNFNGFMSVGAGVLSNDDVSSSGFDDDLSFTQDTMVALQVSKQVNQSTSATTQFVARGVDDYKTENAWAYITYKVSDNSDLRIGRLRTPFFYYSDFLEVGYAYNWIRPPAEVYSRLDPFSSINGVDFTRQFTTGSVDGSLQVYFGRYQDDFAPIENAYKIELKNFAGIVVNLTKGNWGTRVSYHQADVYMPDLQGNPAGGPLERLVLLANATGEGDGFVPDGDVARFMQAAATYDNGNYSMIAEWTSLDQDAGLFSKNTAYLISAAKRFSDTSFHLTYATAEDEIDSGRLGDLQKNIQGEESSITLGARFDYDAGTAFKVEAQYIDEKLKYGEPAESAMLYSVSIDLMF